MKHRDCSLPLHSQKCCSSALPNRGPDNSARISTKKSLCSSSAPPSTVSIGGKKGSPAAFHWRKPSSDNGQWFIISVFSKRLWIGRRAEVGTHPVTLLYHHTQHLYRYLQQVQSNPKITLLQFSLALTCTLDHQPVSCPGTVTKQRWFHENVKQGRADKL